MALVGTLNSQNDFGFKNRLINGAMNVWQRGTSFSAPATMTGFTADRWSAVWGTASRTYSQQTGFSGFQYCNRAQVNSGASAGWQGHAQIIEYANMVDLAGQTVTLSFYARCGANFSSSNGLQAYVVTGTTADEGGGQYWSPGWTGVATATSQQASVTTTAQRFSYTCTIPSNAKELIVGFQYLSVGTAGANDWYEITGVQLEKGSVATNFDWKPYGTELQLCQRYFWKLASAGDPNLFGIAASLSSNIDVIFYPTPSAVPMRTTPTVTTSAANTFGTWPGGSGGSNILGNTFYSVGPASPYPASNLPPSIEFMLALSSSPGTAVNRFGFRSASGYIQASAEL